ncbi:hypothetical protein P3X46_000330 [Hevea brasiliensis]|uniref:Reverse transcriptase zinc-binding domain-containing protein n=1 Tax=Hevea brasiliensis TaxID=3981 RepID=A0ABQ9N8Z3_HEVBR|nr:hypothetical protein P3X46_000330 [Hevea brasiliensis]
MAFNINGFNIFDNILFVLGNGEKIYFWHDKWIGEAPLKFSFPRLFSISSNQEAVVSEMGLWQNDSLFTWENGSLDQLLALLNSVNLCRSRKDKLVWKLATNGTFSVHSLYSCLINASTQVSFCSSSLWQGLLPPKVELLVWLACRDRLCCRGRLSSINIISPSQSGFPLCSDASESVSYLFLHCYHSWRLWNWFFSWWDLKFCLPKTVDALLNQWNSLYYGNFQRKFWLNLFYAIVWSLWLSRNDMVFNNKETDTISLCSLILVRVAT